jgi:hypothetical protein
VYLPAGVRWVAGAATVGVVVVSPRRRRVETPPDISLRLNRVMLSGRNPGDKGLH